MDRNERKNSYKNLSSSRSSARDFYKMKRRLRILSICIILLATVVIVEGFFVGKLYIEFYNQIITVTDDEKEKNVSDKELGNVMTETPTIGSVE